MSGETEAERKRVEEEDHRREREEAERREPARAAPHGEQAHQGTEGTTGEGRKDPDLVNED